MQSTDLRIFSIQAGQVSEFLSLQALCSAEAARLQAPAAAQGDAAAYYWIACSRDLLQTEQTALQRTLQAVCGLQLLDLHIADLLNPQLPSHYDYTSQYDLVVFRRLNAAAQGAGASSEDINLLQHIDTNPVGFCVLDRVLLTVHPQGCTVRNHYAAKLLTSTSVDARAAGARLPTSPADLMLRIINLMVDGYLALRRELTQQLDRWQTQLIDPRSGVHNWASLLETRLALHRLDEVCEEQRACIQDWIEAVKTWPEPDTPAAARERELLQVRSRDVLEHIERVLHHVSRLEQSAETAVQMHFSAQSHRTNNIMRTLTALTAIFLPLNLIAAIFGMNFDFIPLLHTHTGFWWALGSMLAIAVVLGLVFWRKRYLSRSSR